MSDPILIGKTLTIRECGLDEYWLQEQIYKNPSILKLGDLAPTILTLMGIAIPKEMSGNVLVDK